MAITSQYDAAWLTAKALTDLAAILLFMWMSKLILDVIFSALQHHNDNSGTSYNTSSIMNLTPTEEQLQPTVTSYTNIPGSYVTINLQYWYNPTCYDDEIVLESKTPRVRSSDTIDSESGVSFSSSSSQSGDDDDGPRLFSPQDLRNLLNDDLSDFTDINWSVILNVNKSSGFSETKMCSMCTPIVEGESTTMSMSPMSTLPVMHVTSVSYLNVTDKNQPPFPKTKRVIFDALTTHWMGKCNVYMKSMDEIPIK